MVSTQSIQGCYPPHWPASVATGALATLTICDDGTLPAEGARAKPMLTSEQTMTESRTSAVSANSLCLCLFGLRSMTCAVSRPCLTVSSAPFGRLRTTTDATPQAGMCWHADRAVVDQCSAQTTPAATPSLGRAWSSATMAASPLTTAATRRVRGRLASPAIPSTPPGRACAHVSPYRPESCAGAR